MGVRCRFWTGQDSDEIATLFDLLRLRHQGYASLPTDYEVSHESANGYDYVVIREHVKQRDGSDLRGAPGFVDHRYLEDEARDQFELVDSTPEEPEYAPRMLQAIGDPLGFLGLHWDAVCNGRRSFPEVRAQLAAEHPDLERKSPAEPTIDTPPRAPSPQAAPTSSRPASTSDDLPTVSVDPATIHTASQSPG
jgi:hypothetical protein